MNAEDFDDSDFRDDTDEIPEKKSKPSETTTESQSPQPSTSSRTPQKPHKRPAEPSDDDTRGVDSAKRTLFSGTGVNSAPQSTTSQASSVTDANTTHQIDTPTGPDVNTKGTLQGEAGNRKIQRTRKSLKNTNQVCLLTIKHTYFASKPKNCVITYATF